jgi:RHS repeat-associated protein
VGYPYGAERWTDGTLPTDYRFTGQREEASLGLYHMGARFYDPHLARFVQPDTIIPDFANPQSLNAYSYVYNQPLKLVDPIGRAGTPAKLIRGAGKDYGALPYRGVVKVPEPDPVKTMRARAVARLVVSVAYEPADWAMTFHDWSQGDFSLWDLAGLLPLIPASADNFVDAFRAAENLEDAADVLRGVAKSGGPDVALGINKKLQIGDFARQTKSHWYGEWHDIGLTDRRVSSFNFGPSFEQAMNRAGNIHFNLDDIRGDPIEFAKLGGTGDFGQVPFTARELYLIWQNPEWLAKTIFYQNGQVVSSPFSP